MPTVFADTHAHLYSNQFDNDRDAMVQRALQAGVRYLFLPNIDLPSIPTMLDLEAAYPQHCFAMMGLHPCSAEANYLTDLRVMEDWLAKRRFVAIGEIGLDYYWSKEFIAEQKEAFRIQCRWAKELDIPTIIHARDSLDDLIELVREEKTDRLRGIFHCFSGTAAQAKAVLELGFLIGIGGVITYKNSGLADAIREVPLSSIVLETDAPYLTPVPHRGKRNESSYIPLIAEKLADVLHSSIDEIARVTTANALQLFGVVPA